MRVAWAPVRGGLSRGDLKELGAELEAGTAAVIVLGESKMQEELEKAVTRANKLIEKEVDADADALKRDIDATASESPASGLAGAGGRTGRPVLPKRRAGNGRRLGCGLERLDVRRGRMLHVLRSYA